MKSFIQRIFKYTTVCRNSGAAAIQSMRLKAVRICSYSYALLWHKFYWLRYHFSIWRTQYGPVAISVVLFLLIWVSAYFSSILQSVLEPYLSAQNRFADLRFLFLALGSALIGAAAIAFSLIMFAMQVNVERTPHGLFRKLSTDRRIIGAFGGTFLLAISIASTSLIPDISWVARGILGSIWGMVLIFVLFLYAYRRALLLINPLKQLSILVKDSNREMEAWARRAKRAALLFRSDKSNNTVKGVSPGTTRDIPRIVYFQANPHWTAKSQQAIQYASSFAKRYAEYGDHEISAEALKAVIAINQSYVKAKGKTFFSYTPLIDDQMTTDEFINYTLEFLRQNIRIGISRGDEQQIEQTLQTIAALVLVYIKIDYSDEFASKTHAHIASAYLSEAVEAVVPHNMADVLMEGVRLMGESAHLFLKYSEPNSIATLTDKISLIACTGIAIEKYRPVTLSAIEQLAKLTLALIKSKKADIRIAAKHIKENVTMVTKLFLKVPDTPLENAHSTYLAPYYSGATMQSLPSWLTDLVNALAETKPENEDAKTIIGNIEMWADELFQAQKELLLLAIEKRSHFTFYMIHWITHVTEVLLALSNAPACDNRTRDELRKHGLWLISTLSWIPDDKETVAFVEVFQLTETLFKVAIDAYYRGCSEIFEQIQGMLMGWAFKGGRHQTGWAILERSLYGLVTLALIGKSPPFNDIKRQIAGRLSNADAPDQKILDRTARDIRRRAATLYRQGHRFSRIEHEMSKVDHSMMKSQLEELANLLPPHTSDESVDIDLW